MNTLKHLMTGICLSSLVALCVLVLSGCQSVENRNAVLVDIAIGQGVARYIDAGATAIDDAKRRDELIAVLSVARQFIDSDVPVSSINWSDEFVRLMKWDSLDVGEQILLAQLVELVRKEIELRTGGNDEVEMYLGRFIDVAIDTAGRM